MRGPPGDTTCFGLFLVHGKFCDNCVVGINSVSVHECVERRKTTCELNGVRNWYELGFHVGLGSMGC